MRVSHLTSPTQDWFGQGIADLPSDPVWGVPFMAGVLLFACSFLVCFFERERRLGRLGNALRWAVDSQMLVQAGSAAFCDCGFGPSLFVGWAEAALSTQHPLCLSHFPFLIPHPSRPNNLSLRSKSYAHCCSIPHPGCPSMLIASSSLDTKPSATSCLIFHPLPSRRPGGASAAKRKGVGID